MMEAREFWGKDMGEALQAVRASLGSDALILETFSVPAANGTEGDERIKITAMRPQTTEVESAPVAVPSRKPTVNTREPELSRPPRPSAGGGREGAEARGLRDVHTQLSELKTMLYWLLPGMRSSSAVNDLVAQDVPPELLIRLLQDTAGEKGEDERALFRRAVQQLAATGGDVETKPARRTCLALIGPPGTGKTTTLVKLTVHLLRKSDRKIGWISLDNQRVNGAEELTVYAGILGLPCEVAEGAEGLSRAVKRLSACDFILIDTPGVNPRDASALTELAGVLQGQGLPNLRRTLVLSAATNWRDLSAWAQRYERVGYDSLLFSMMDACGCFGPLVHTIVSSGRPLSYVASGSRVTQGIELARPESLADLLLP